MHKYRLISKKGEGTFSEVLKAQSIRSGKYFAIKCMKNHFDSIDQVNNLREIQALRRLAGHPNIIKLHEVLYDEPQGRLALVFELMDMNLYEAIKGRRHYLPEAKVKQYMYELMKALDHMHRNGIFHRDVKPENLLLLDDEIKLADLGSCRGIYSRQPYTEYISTRWYRAPECLLTDGYYNFKMDLFAAGCVWFEIAALFPLFPGQNEMDQIQKIHNVLGTPDPELLSRKFRRNASHMDLNFPEKKGTGIERLVPHADPEVVELIKKLIKYDPDERMLARQALKDPYFRDLRDADKERAAGTTTPFQTATHPRSSAREHPPKEETSVISPSSSTASMDHSRTPEVKNPSQPDSPAVAGLPTIRQERRKAGAPPAPQGDTTSASPTALGGAGGVSEGEDPDDGTLLPPIGGAKGKQGKSSKNKSFKASSNPLQKSSISLNSTSPQAQHASHLGALTNSKGFGPTMGGAAPSGHTTGHGPWASVGHQDHSRSGSGGTGAAEKMSSTWAPNHQPRKYVSPFGRSKKR